MSQPIKMTLAVDAARAYIAAVDARREAEQRADNAERDFLAALAIPADDYKSRTFAMGELALTYNASGIHSLTPIEWVSP